MQPHDTTIELFSQAIRARRSCGQALASCRATGVLASP
jgi:hypothetical protein